MGVKELIRIGDPVEKIQLVERQTIIAEGGIQWRILICQPVLVKK
jgi:hypothetical protein